MHFIMGELLRECFMGIDSSDESHVGLRGIPVEASASLWSTPIQATFGLHEALYSSTSSVIHWHMWAPCT